MKFSDKSDLLKDQGRYRRLVGRLIYLTVSRPDITYAVHVLSRFMHQPRKAHMEVALRVVRYLKNAPGQGLFFSSNNDFRMRAYCDLDWAGCPLTTRSTTGYCVFLGPSLISWRSKRRKSSVTLFGQSRISCNDRSLPFKRFRCFTLGTSLTALWQQGSVAHYSQPCFPRAH